jgi:hypothetical protein
MSHMSVANRTSPTARLTWIGCLLSLAAGCSDPVGPKLVTPRVDELFFSDLPSDFVADGVLYIHAVPADLTFRLGETERVPIELSTSAGDRENLKLFRLFCPPRERISGFDCFRFALLMRDGFNAIDLRADAAAIGGRLHRISTGGRIASVTVFESGDIASHARRARSWPGVGFVDLLFSGCQDFAVAWCGSHARLTTPVAVDVGEAIVGDGILQVQRGDTVIVQYRQPSGEIREARVVAP